jgi:tetrapyrrole methylase family protein/MazG family protein
LSGGSTPDSFGELKAIIARLRGPGGCPWDREQTHSSLKTTLLEECYEVLQALEDGSPPKLCEELGDLMLQIMLHSQIASEAGHFDVDGVIRGITAKIVRRHPHIFGDARADNAQEVMQRWELLKREERDEGHSLLDSVPPAMPALAYSHSIQRRAAGVGFDWENADGVLDKLGEELAELRKAEGQEERSREFGDLLFTLVNLARRTGVDLEVSLRGANDRFRRRFQYLAAAGRRRGTSLDRLSPREQNALWEEAKKALDNGPPI